jgi:hypothetical protein
MNTAAGVSPTARGVNGGDFRMSLARVPRQLLYDCGGVAH